MSTLKELGRLLQEGKHISPEVRLLLRSAVKDGERYHFLRNVAVAFEYSDESPTPYCVEGTEPNDSVPLQGDALDEAIDKAIAANNRSHHP